MNERYRSMTNLAANQALWFIGIIAGDAWALFTGVIYALVYCRYIGNLHKEWRSIGLIVMIGYSTDLLLSFLGFIHFSSALPLPLWLLVLWASFATLMHHGLQWLESHLLLAVLAGSVLGPLSYYAGAELGDSDITAPLHLFVMAYGIVWAIFIPLFLKLVRLI